MRAREPMIQAGAGAPGEPANGERKQRCGLLPPLIGGQSILEALDGHRRAPGVGRPAPCGPLTFHLTRRLVGCRQFSSHPLVVHVESELVWL
jgi:hypothetical protein